MKPFVVENLRPLLENKKILLGISGSIAAFKACDIIRLLRDLGAQVRVVPTDNALHFVTKITLETLSENPVVTDLWHSQGTHHIDASRWADIALIAPATANTIAKIAHGLADDLLSTELLAFTGPVFIAPAMNPAMFENQATQENLTKLKSRGITTIGPASGLTSCGEEGLGRMVEAENIVTALALALKAPAKNKTILVTLGPTRSFLDPVRYLTNRSSGLMGAALCWEATRRGYNVVAVKGPCAVDLPGDTKVIEVETADEMLLSCQEIWPRCHALLATAAVLDWDVAQKAPEKLKKQPGTAAPSLALKVNPDILKTLCENKNDGQWVLGFAAETENLLLNGEKKLKTKNCNFLFANDVSQTQMGFDSQLNSGLWIQRSELGNIESFEYPTQSKIELAVEMFNRMESHWFHRKSSYVSENVC